MTTNVEIFGEAQAYSSETFSWHLMVKMTDNQVQK